MPTRSSRVAAAVGLAAALAAARPAAACPDGGLELAIMTSRFTIAPTASDRLGLDLLSRGPRAAWGCAELRHHVTSIELEAPDAGDDDRQILRVAGYRAELPLGDGAVELGLHLLVRWGDVTRFATPTIAVRAAPTPDLRLRVELDAAGAYLLAYDPAPRHLTDDLALDASAAWPARAATRGEVRLRARRYTLAAEPRRDVTLTVGLGLALGARDGARALPGFLGVAARLGDDPAALLVAELAYGVAGP
ncbi:MAG: hypothetical protein JNK64_35325 [Myxococcales bacterium]|nr:hypothetical protein [Myxococcales bacterium]